MKTAKGSFISSKDSRNFLFDIIEAANDIEEFVADITLEDYISDIQVKAAVERKFEIIGEALNRIKKVSPELLDDITEYKKSITFRNILAHGYDIVSDPIVWDIIHPIFHYYLKKQGQFWRTSINRISLPHPNMA